MHDLQEAEAFIERFTTLKPELGLVLGSGLSELANLVTDPVTIETSSIPGYPASTVQGHKGRLVIGKIEGVAVVFVQGRIHVYEGHSVHDSTFPIRLLARMGVERLVITNAAGGINPGFKPGTLMWITDHINWTRYNPLAGASAREVQVARTAFSPSPYDGVWTSRAMEMAEELGISTSTGTYLWTLGPSYETKAEIRAFNLMGADAVGMSTVPEVIQARALGMRVLGLSTITNFAAGLSDDELNHEEVLEVGRQVRTDLERLVMAIIKD